MVRGRRGGSLLSETLPVKQIQRNIQGSSLDSSLTLFYIQTTNILVSNTDFCFIEVERYALWATYESSNFFVLLCFLLSLSCILHLIAWCCPSSLVYCHLEDKVVCRKLNYLVFEPAMTEADRAKLNKPLNKRESKSVFLSNRDG